jgi:hypothetical protein
LPYLRPLRKETRISEKPAWRNWPTSRFTPHPGIPRKSQTLPPPSRLSPGTIQKYGYRTLADILRSVRGFDVTYDRAYCYLGVSGINRPETYNSNVLLLIDGHRTNNNVYEQAMLGIEFPLDVDLIE